MERDSVTATQVVQRLRLYQRRRASTCGCVFAQVVTTWDSKASDRNADACSNLEPRLREVVCILAPWFGAHAFVPCISVQVVAQRQDLISELLQKLRQEAAEANDGSQ